MKLSGALLVFALTAISAVHGSPQRGRAGKQAAGGCRANGPNYSSGGKDYLVSWREEGCSDFTQAEAVAFCRGQRMKPISLDTPAKEKEFTSLVGRENKKYFWTGGAVNHGKKPTITWPSGKTTSSTFWSNTGGLKRPQPDNREGNEFCLAVLNSFYNDGVKYHDVSCRHKKPVICEA